jgi:hypothetical protein
MIGRSLRVPAILLGPTGLRLGSRKHSVSGAQFQRHSGQWWTATSLDSTKGSVISPTTLVGEMTRSEEPDLDCLGNGFVPVGDVELAVDVAEVGFQCVDRHVDLVGDLLVSEPAR